MNGMVYDFKTHSLNYRNQDIDSPNFSLAIDTLEIIFELNTGKLLGVQGFFPLHRAIVCDIDLPKGELRDYFLHNVDLSMFKKNEVYDLIRKIPHMQNYFKSISVKFDKVKLIIQIGEKTNEVESIIKVNNNILCGLDNNLDLRCIYIIPDEFIG